MRGADVFQESLFSVRKLDDFVPESHPLRPIREQVNRALKRLDGLFAKMYAEDERGGRPWRFRFMRTHHSGTCDATIPEHVSPAFRDM